MCEGKLTLYQYHWYIEYKVGRFNWVKLCRLMYCHNQPAPNRFEELNHAGYYRRGLRALVRSSDQVLAKRIA